MKKAAVEHGIEMLQPERLSKACQEKGKMRAFAPDAIVVVAYGQILNDEILSMPELGCFNVHASLLPRFRGAAPMQHAILSGEEKTGITIMRMDEGLDTGDMVAKEETYIGGKNFKDIHDELSRMGARLMADTLPRIESSESEYTPQNSEEATYAPKQRNDMIAIADYGVGNIFSLYRFFEAIGADARLTDDPAVLRRADRLVLLGVGAFGDAAAKLEASGLRQTLIEEAEKVATYGTKRWTT